MEKKLRTAYINKMLPHLLPARAKSMNITPANKTEWRDLVQSIKIELLNRFDTSSNKEILNDMSFNKKKLPSVSADINYDMNDRIIQGIPYISREKREWIKNMRINLLDIAIQEEKKLSKALIDKGVTVFQKMPFIVNGNTYFANLYLPDHNVIIDVLKSKPYKDNIYVKSKQRHSNLKRTGNKVVIVKDFQIKSKNNIEDFINNILGI